jgi:hypothetical protein
VLEEILEGVLLLSVDTEAVPYPLPTDPDQSLGLFSLSVDATTVYAKKDY